jgi:hypothetical protein
MNGINAHCGHKLTNLHVDAGKTIRTDLMVALDLYANDKPPDDYTQWLNQIYKATQSDLSHVTGTSFPLQRVTGITVQAGPVTLTNNDGTLVLYTVYAQWQGRPESSPG